MEWYGPHGHGGPGYLHITQSHYEEFPPAGGGYLCETQETLEEFMAEAPDERPRITVPGCQREVVECIVILQVFIVFLTLGRILQSFKEKCSLQGNKESASSNSALAVVKCNALNESLPSLDEDESAEVPDDLGVIKPVRRNFICTVVRQERKEKPRCSYQELQRSETAGKIQAQDHENKTIETQVQEVKTCLKHLPAVDKRLKLSIGIFMASIKSQALSLQEDRLEVIEWAAFLVGKNMGENLESGERGKGDHVTIQARGPRRKLQYAARSSGHLNFQDREQNQFCINIAKTKKTAHLRGLHTGAHTAETSFKRVGQHLVVRENKMTKQPHQKDMECLGKFPGKADLDIQQEVGSSEANDTKGHENKGLETYQKQARDLELQPESTISLYQKQILSLETNTVDDWLGAQDAEQTLLIVRQKTTDLGQNLGERAIPSHPLEVDLHGCDDGPSRAFGRENVFPDSCA